MEGSHAALYKSIQRSATSRLATAFPVHHSAPQNKASTQI